VKSAQKKKAKHSLHQQENSQARKKQHPPLKP